MDSYQKLFGRDFLLNGLPVPVKPIKIHLNGLEDGSHYEWCAYSEGYRTAAYFEERLHNVINTILPSDSRIQRCNDFLVMLNIIITQHATLLISYGYGNNFGAIG
jgi:hypothetical protein